METTGIRQRWRIPGPRSAWWTTGPRRVRTCAILVLIGLSAGTWTPRVIGQEFAPPLKPGQSSSTIPNVDDVIVDIQVEGNLTIPDSAVLRHIKTQRDRPAEPLVVREDVRALYATRWFFSVEPRFRRTAKGMSLVFKVFERPVVRQVQYVGNKKVKTKHLEALTNIKAGSPYDVTSNKEAARRIEQTYHEKGFAFATVELARGAGKDDRDVVFQINEGPKTKVTKISFDGNEFFSSSLLKTKLRTKAAFLSWLGIKFLGGKYDPSTIPDDIASLKQYYHSLGFFDVKIDKQILFSDDKASVHIAYSISEGTRYEIQGIHFEGNRVLAVGSLRDGSKLQSGEYFNSRNLNHDVAKMQDQYGELGRLFAKVDAIPRFLETPGKVDIVYQVDEDRVRMIRRINVHYDGDMPHTRETVVLNRSLIHPGDLANNQLIQRTKARLEGSQLFDRGPVQGVSINISPVDDDSLQLAGGSIRGQNPALVPTSHHVSSSFGHTVNVPGTNSFPKPYTGHAASTAAEKRTGFLYDNARPGSTSPDRSPVAPVAPIAFPTTNQGPVPQAVRPLTSEMTIRGQDETIRGQSDGVFDPNNPMFGNSPQGDPLTNIFREPPPGWVDLDISATEARTGRLMFGVGVNSDAGLVGSIVLDESNFDIFRPPTSWSDIINGHAWRGAGQRFRMEVIPGDIVSRYLVSWTEPYFLDTDFSLSLSGFYFNRFYPDWDEDRLGGRISVGRQLSNDFSINAAIRLEEVTLKNPDTPTPPDLQKLVGSSFLSTVRLGAAYDTRDSAFLPSDGHIIQGGYEQAFGDFLYPRLDAEARKYFTLMSRPDGTGKHILSVGGQLGWTDTNTPVFERFFAGGFQTFRGFEFRGVSPRENGVEVGGNFMMLGTAEYKLPITADDNIAVVAFSDFGTVEPDVSLDDFRITAGAGLRLTVPAMGPVPLAFDFSVPLRKTEFDRTQVFSFYIGLNR